ncbi:MAG TPA: hypothetical protein VFN67_32860 [Polyangiales bacterium]|nr:hypothetical protein [Polyangiales bacterium]
MAAGPCELLRKNGQRSPSARIVRWQQRERGQTRVQRSDVRDRAPNRRGVIIDQQTC